MRKHVVVDTRTGAVIKTEEVDVPSDLTPRQFLERMMDDCPDCQAARARGEQPYFPSPEELEELEHLLASAERPRSRFARRPRWRTMKRSR
jgi:hypothetical protein